MSSRSSTRHLAIRWKHSKEGDSNSNSNQLIPTRMIQKAVLWLGVCARAKRASQNQGHRGGDKKEEGQVVGAGTRWGVGIVWPFGRSAQSRPSALLTRPPFKLFTRELPGGLSGPEVRRTTSGESGCRGGFQRELRSQPLSPCLVMSCRSLVQVSTYS